MKQAEYLGKIAEAKRMSAVVHLLDGAATEHSYALMTDDDYALVEYAARHRMEELATKKTIVPFAVKGETYYAQEYGNSEVRLWSAHGKLLMVCYSWQEVLNWANRENGKVA